MKIIYVNQHELKYQSNNEFSIKNVSPDDILKSKLENETVLLIPCELNIDSNGKPVKRTVLYGIQLAQELRLKGFSGRILFLSFLSFEDILEKPNTQILTSIGHGFVRLPVIIDDIINTIEQIKILSPIELYDIQANYCSRLGLAQQKIHALNSNLNDKNISKNEVIAKIEDCVTYIGKLYNYDVTHFINGFVVSDIREAIRETEIFCNKILTLHDTSNTESQNEKDKKKWSILFLDDEINEDSDLLKGLSECVERVFCVNNAVDGFNILEKDAEEGHRIALVISDYRLYKTVGNIKVHQDCQGYSFLMKVSEKYPHLGLAAVSALPRKFLLQSFKRMGIRADIYSKIDYTKSENTLKILIDELIEKGEENFNATIRLPRMSNTNWELFEPFYLKHRLSPEYHADESYISNKAKAYCEEYSKGNHIITLSEYTKELKGKTKIPQKPKAFREFLEKMVCRRVGIWYAVQQNTTNVLEIHQFLTGNFNSDKYRYFTKKEINTAKNQTNTSLALSFTEFPHNLTYEEKQWLIYAMRIKSEKIERIEAQELQILEFAEKKLSKIETPPFKYAPNTFLRCKFWLHAVRFKMDPDWLKNTIVSPIKTEILRLTPNGEVAKIQTKSLKDFYFYLKKLENYLTTKEKKIPKDWNLADPKSIEAKVLKKSRSKFKNLEKADIVSFLVIFLHNLKQQQKSYGTDNAYYQAFEEYVKSEIGDFNDFADFEKVSFSQGEEEDAFAAFDDYRLFY